MRCLGGPHSSSSSDSNAADADQARGNAPFADARRRRCHEFTWRPSLTLYPYSVGPTPLGPLHKDLLLERTPR